MPFTWSGGHVICQNNAETGLTTGTAVSTANSDDGTAGNAFDIVTLSGTSTLVYTSTTPIHDSLSHLYTATGGFCVGIWTAGGALASVRTTGLFCAAGYVRWTTGPASSSPFVLIQEETAGGIRVCDLRMLSTGIFDFRGTNQSSIVSLSSAGAMALGTVYRWELELDLDASPTAYWVALFTGESETPLQEASGSSANLGAAVGRVTFGRVQSPDFTVRMDSIGCATARLGPINPAPAPDTPPTAAAVVGDAYQMIDATGSTVGEFGTLDYAISPTTGVIDQGDGTFLVPNTTQNYTITVTEDPSGLSDGVGVGVTAVTGVAIDDWPKRPSGTPPTSSWG